MNRRRFLKYAGATAAVVGVSAIGLDYVLSPRPQPVNQSTVTLNPMRSTSKQNHPPVANFKYKPYYLNPTDQQTLQFTNLSTDPDGDPLTYMWLVDGQPVSEEKDYSAKLPVGQREVDLEVSDPLAKSTVSETVTVEPDQIYPAKQLNVKYKGINYAVGDFLAHDPKWSWVRNGWSPPTTDMIKEHLGTIHNELGCNAIVMIAGDGSEDNLIEGCQLAVSEGFDRVYAQIRYVNSTLEETKKKLADFASRMRILRQASEAIVFEFGCEFTYDSIGILPGDTMDERIHYAATHPKHVTMIEERLPAFLRQVISVVQSNYGYAAAYSAHIEEITAALVPWLNPVFGSVDFEAYIEDKWHMDENYLIQTLSDLRKFGKPVNFSEFGCRSAKGAAYLGAELGDLNAPVDEGEQAEYIARYSNMVNKINSGRRLVDGAYYWDYFENWDAGFGLVNHDGTRRKKGFYMYKSYQRAA